ncbi:hypothetical protein DT075_10435 [Bacillus licheniformis]|nr:hypothetical protein DT075_10435 [Bacillus licheniformis]
MFYHKNYQKIKLDDQNSRTLTIGPDLKHSVTIKHFSFEKGPVTLEKQKDSDALNVQLGGETVSSFAKTEENQQANTEQNQADVEAAKAETEKAEKEQAKKENKEKEDKKKKDDK